MILRITIAQNEERMNLELKPTLGDDYPAVLREIKSRARAHYASFLVVGTFEASGASFEQVGKIFRASGIQVFRVQEIESMLDRLKQPREA